jgi:hypothetical protein
MMMNLNHMTIMLVATIQISLVTAIKASPNTSAVKVVRNGIVTAEVSEELRTLRKEAAKEKAGARRHRSPRHLQGYQGFAYWGFPSWFGSAAVSFALVPRLYPSLTVNVVPPEPRNFIVAINHTPYPPGARKFWVKPDKALITVTRAGKELCEATLDFTEKDSTDIDCPPASGSTEKVR